MYMFQILYAVLGANDTATTLINVKTWRPIPNVLIKVLTMTVNHAGAQAPLVKVKFPLLVPCLINAF